MRLHTSSSAFVISTTILLILATAGTGMRTHAATPAPETTSVTCDSLSVTPGDDQNTYVLKAAASGPSSIITGYTFDYGDHESYSIAFGSKIGVDHHSATITHTYKKPGTYTVTAHVTIKTHSKSTDISSNTCKTSATVLPTGSTLPNTGIHGATFLGICAVIGLIVAIFHNFYLRRSST